VDAVTYFQFFLGPFSAAKNIEAEGLLAIMADGQDSSLPITIVGLWMCVSEDVVESCILYSSYHDVS
jgi:hypothetical protein